MIDDARLEEIEAMARRLDTAAVNATQLDVPELVAEVRRLREALMKIVDAGPINGRLTALAMKTRAENALKGE